MNKADEDTTPDESSRNSPEVLRAKYLDYCSARVADALLSLSPDEMYILAKSATERSVTEAGESADPPSYSSVVAATTGRIYDRLKLPSFEEWARAYRKDPTEFDHYLMGFWESETSKTPPGQ